MTSAELDPGEELRQAGWRQGSVIDREVLHQLIGDDAANFDGGIVVSQDCDLVRGIETEPELEIIGATISKTSDGNLRFGRNPRLLEVPSDEGADTKALRLCIRDRWTIEKSLLCGHRPSTGRSVARQDVRLIADWVAKRYTRPAFPDEFNRRLRATEEKVEKILKRSPSEHVSALLFMLDEAEAELPLEKAYPLVVWIVVVAHAYRDERLQGAFNKLESDLREAFGGCAGIRLDELEVRSEADVTLHDLREFRRYDRDYRSYSKPDSELPPGGI